MTRRSVRRLAPRAGGPGPIPRLSRLGRAAIVAALTLLWCVAGNARMGAQTTDTLPEITQPVTDLAGIIDAASAARIDQMSRELQAATGDVVVVVTVPLTSVASANTAVTTSPSAAPTEDPSTSHLIQLVGC